MTARLCAVPGCPYHAIVGTDRCLPHAEPVPKRTTTWGSTSGSPPTEAQYVDPDPGWLDRVLRRLA
jgi:hypothetical protein